MRWATNTSAAFESDTARRLREVAGIGLRAYAPYLRDLNFPSRKPRQCGSPRTFFLSIHGRRVDLTLSLSPEPQNSMDPPVSPRDGSATVNFWRSLNKAERQAISAMARERTFARGARLMREGDQADHVMVILQGRTQITVHNRIIAELGPGHLIGERGALRVNVRSATVTALETIHALVMTTENFADFISAHPRVLDIIENQIYDRLTDEPPRHGDRQPTGHLALLSGENCTVVVTDVVGFGAHIRTDHDRQIIRRASLDMMRTSLGPLWEACVWHDLGDGLLIVVPSAIPTAKVMDSLHRELPDLLAMHNRAHREPAHIRLRVAVNVGPVITDSVGLAGQAIIRTTRLADDPVFKQAMDTADARLGIITSVFVYETAIRHSGGGIDFQGYNVVRVRVKETDVPAWMHLALALAGASIGATGRALDECGGRTWLPGGRFRDRRDWDRRVWDRRLGLRLEGGLSDGAFVGLPQLC